MTKEYRKHEGEATCPHCADIKLQTVACCVCAGTRLVPHENLPALMLNLWEREGCECNACTHLRKISPFNGWGAAKFNAA